MIFINEVIEFEKNNTGFDKYRILYIKNEVYCYLLRLNAHSMTEVFKMSILEIDAGLESGYIKKVDDNFIHVDECDKHQSSKMISKKNLNYEIVSYVVEKLGEPFIFEKSPDKCKVIKEAHKIYGKSIPCIYSLICRYYKGCRLKDALSPAYHNCGGKGKKRTYKNKPGRGNDYSEGKVLDGNDTEYFKEIYSFYISNPKIEISINKAYKKLKSKFYTTIVNGEAEFKSEDQIPTYEQFRYYCLQQDKVKAYINKHGQNAFELNARPTLGSTVNHIEGAGFRYEIDMTQLDIGLTNSLTKKYIGPAQLYLAVDSYSKLIAGMYIDVEGESQDGIMHLLYNCHSDKVAFIKKYKLDIPSGVWPSRGLPQVILADRGKLVGPSMEEKIENLNIIIENTPTKRGDLKGNVERAFDTINKELKAFLPGGKVHKRERCQPDDRLQAKMNIEQLYRAVISIASEMNSRKLVDYDMSREMILDQVECRPMKIWLYSTQKQSGNLQVFPNNFLIGSLMKTKKVTITRAGIKFLGYQI
jgi:Integrase core domain.